MPHASEAEDSSSDDETVVARKPTAAADKRKEKADFVTDNEEDDFMSGAESCYDTDAATGKRQRTNKSFAEKLRECTTDLQLIKCIVDYYRKSSTNANGAIKRFTASIQRLENKKQKDPHSAADMDKLIAQNNERIEKLTQEKIPRNTRYVTALSGLLTFLRARKEHYSEVLGRTRRQ